MVWFPTESRAAGGGIPASSASTDQWLPQDKSDPGHLLCPSRAGQGTLHLRLRFHLDQNASCILNFPQHIPWQVFLIYSEPEVQQSPHIPQENKEGLPWDGVSG